MPLLEAVATTTETDWNNFFEYLTSGAAAILGLAFLAFSLNREHWRTNALRQPLAAMNLAELASPVFFGLIYLMPGHHWLIAGWVVSGPAYLGMAWYYRNAWHYRSEAKRFDRWQRWLMIVSVLTFSAIAWIPLLSVKASVLIWMICSGLIESWVFLVPGDEPKKPTVPEGTEA